MNLDFSIFFADLGTKLDEIILFEKEVQDVFEILKSKDPKNGQMIKQTFTPLMKHYSDQINKWVEQHKNEFSKGKRLSTKRVFALENLEDILEAFANEIKARISPFITYSETMARRRSDLQAFAMETEEKFFRDLLDEIEKLFDDKRDKLYEKIEREFGVKERLTDVFLKPLEKGLKWTMEKTSLKSVKDSRWDQTWFEKAIEAELGRKVLEEELRKIFKKAQDNFQKAWEKKASEVPPDLKVTESFISSVTEGGAISIPLNLDISTSVLTSGLTASVAAVAGLAAGWHTLEYALASVFPPAAVITALLTAFVFLFTSESAKESRKEQVNRLVETYYARVLASFQNLKRIKKEEKLLCTNQGIKIRVKKERVEYNSLYELIHSISIACVNTIMEKWEKEISGNLTAEDYHKLTVDISKYLAKINKAVVLIRNTLQSLREGVNHGV